MPETHAIRILLSEVETGRYYSAPATCIKTKNLGYKNAGYTVELVAAGCPGLAAESLLGRWRIDAFTGELFAQDTAGKYRTPKRPGTTASPILREARSVLVDAVHEVWRLEWKSAPKSVCGPEGGWDDWGMCPCAGFVFGEAGELDLVRLRPGAPEERLPLSPLFKDYETPGPGAILKRWPELKGDQDRSEKTSFPASVKARTPVQIMELADYDHDGRATEFVLQIGSGPCGHQQSVVVGIDIQNPKLHAFTAIDDPTTPIVLERPGGWKKLRDSKGPVVIDEWICGDHGTEEHETITLRTDAKGLHAKRTKKACGK